MKKLLTIIWAMVFAMAIVGCYKQPQQEVEEAKPILEINLVSKEEAPRFSYEEESTVYLSDDVEFVEETEVKQSGFYNITKSDIVDTVEAYERAKLECSIQYDKVSIFYDSTTDMWRVYFFTSKTNGQSGDSQLVYLNGDGITRLIVTCR